MAKNRIKGIDKFGDYLMLFKNSHRILKKKVANSVAFSTRKK